MHATEPRYQTYLRCRQLLHDNCGFSRPLRAPRLRLARERARACAEAWAELAPWLVCASAGPSSSASPETVTLVCTRSSSWPAHSFAVVDMATKACHVCALHITTCTGSISWVCGLPLVQLSTWYILLTAPAQAMNVALVSKKSRASGSSTLDSGLPPSRPQKDLL